MASYHINVVLIALRCILLYAVVLFCRCVERIEFSSTFSFLSALSFLDGKICAIREPSIIIIIITIVVVTIIVIIIMC